MAYQITLNDQEYATLAAVAAKICTRFNDGIAEGVLTFLALKISTKRIVFEAKEEAAKIHSGFVGEEHRLQLIKEGLPRRKKGDNPCTQFLSKLVAMYWDALRA